MFYLKKLSVINDSNEICKVFRAEFQTGLLDEMVTSCRCGTKINRLVTKLSQDLKLIYSKQPIVGLTQEFCWEGAYVGRRAYLSKQLSSRDEARERNVIVN